MIFEIKPAGWLNVTNMEDAKTAWWHGEDFYILNESERYAYCSIRDKDHILKKYDAIKIWMTNGSEEVVEKK